MPAPTRPHCWICGGALESASDGEGRTGWNCARCRPEIELLQAQVKGVRRNGSRVGGRLRTRAVRAIVIAEFKDKRPLYEISRRVGRTHERVRQILVDAGLWTPKPYRRTVQ